MIKTPRCQYKYAISRGVKKASKIFVSAAEVRLNLGTHQGLMGEGSGWLSPKANRALGEDNGIMDKEKLVSSEKIKCVQCSEGSLARRTIV
jgi:hypothetical protein